MPVQRSTPCKHVCKNKQTCGHPCCKRNLTPTTYELTSTTASGQESGPKEAPSTRQRDETSPPCTRDRVTQDVKVPKSSNLLGMTARAATRYLFSSRTQPYANGTPSTPAVTVRPHSSTGQERLSYTIAPCPKDEHDLHVPHPRRLLPIKNHPLLPSVVPSHQLPARLPNSYFLTAFHVKLRTPKASPNLNLQHNFRSTP